VKALNPTAVVNVKFTSSTTTIRADKKDVLPGVKNIIAVVSGKGGVVKALFQLTWPWRWQMVVPALA
jgi:ATP-binding protein involved in chromosome partitioning